MKFDSKHIDFFNCKSGAFSEVTPRERKDSQVTVSKDEKEIILKFFGHESIHRGSKSKRRYG